MGIVVYKQWIYSRTKTNVPMAAKNMLEYIATRDGVELIENEVNDDATNKMVDYIATRKGVAIDDKLHGLFGKLNGMKECDDVENLLKASEYVKQMAMTNTTVYNAVISLTEADAVKKGFTSRDDFVNLVKEQINDIGKEMGINPRTLEWAGAVHLIKGHPHVHLMYWDISQKVGINSVNPQKANNIRYKLTKNIFKDELQEIMHEKDFFRKDIIAKIYSNEDSILKNTKNAFYKMSTKDVYKLSQNFLKQEQILDRKGFESKNRKLQSMLLNLTETLKIEYPTGAFKYDYMPPSIKPKIDDISKLIIESNPQIAQAFVDYTKKISEQAKMYGGEKNVNAYKKAAVSSLYKEIGNKILYTIKTSKPSVGYIKHNRYNRTLLLHLCSDILNMIGNTNSNLDNNQQNGDLSMAHKADLKRITKDVTINWNNER